MKLDSIVSYKEIIAFAGDRFHVTQHHVLGYPVKGQSFIVLNHYREETSYTFVLYSIIQHKNIMYYRCVYRQYMTYSIK